MAADDFLNSSHADGLKSGAGAGLIGATVGALLALFIWNRLVVHHVVTDPGGPGPNAGLPADRDGSAQGAAP